MSSNDIYHVYHHRNKATSTHITKEGGTLIFRNGVFHTKDPAEIEQLEVLCAKASEFFYKEEDRLTVTEAELALSSLENKVVPPPVGLGQIVNSANIVAAAGNSNSGFPANTAAAKAVAAPVAPIVVAPASK